MTVYNEREGEVAATVRFVDCSITDELTKTASVAAGSKHTFNHVVKEQSGTCTIAVETGGGLTDRFDWQVGESTLDVRIYENEIELSPK
ncbi:hypothetical protein [Halorhabdus utahensis]|uniref:hypothetical protein n=1 Tax=Halorhabdus utahensis TaxID=146826 RepID=UPI00019BBA2C|nr:hypothetical protein [Halorhabdus utahensis]